ncbi:MAG: hypothetical protein HZB31_04360 [Nitrospirae bacterium]|nr:hypothetical protein [Nitrospirota bacterium]
MNFMLLDLSEVYFIRIQKTPVPHKRGGKFVQLRNSDGEYLVFSPKELSSFHANIVERFCLMQKLKGRYTSKRMDSYEIDDPEWEVVGGGKWHIDTREKRLVLFDTSGTYGRFDSNKLKDRIKASGNMAGYQIQIL